MGRQTHGAKHRQRVADAVAAAQAAAEAAAAVVAAETAAAAGVEVEDVAELDEDDDSPADAAALKASREERRCAKKEKRRLRLAAEAAAAAAAVAIGLPPLVSPKEARRAERRKQTEEKAAKAAARELARQERLAAAAAAPPPPVAEPEAPAEAAAPAEPEAAPVTEAAAGAEPASADPVPAPAKALKIFVGGLPFTHTADDITNFFSAYGEVAAVDCLTFPDSGRFRGIAFVTFATDAGFHAALALNGLEVEDRTLSIKRAKAKELAALGLPAASVPTAATKVGAPAAAPLPLEEGSRVVYCGNLAWEVDEAAVGTLFEGLEVKAVTWGLDKTTGDFRGYAHVEFASPEQAAAALARNGTLLLSRPIRIAPEAKRVVPRTAAEVAADAAAAEATPAATRAYVTGLPYDAAPDAVEAALRRTFSECGALLRLRLGRDRGVDGSAAGGTFRGYAHLDFAEPAGLAAAVALSGTAVEGRPIRVVPALDKRGKAAAAPAAAPEAAGKAPRRLRASAKGSAPKRDMAAFD